MIRHVILNIIFICLSIHIIANDGGDENKQFILNPKSHNFGGHVSLPMKYTRHEEFHFGIRIEPRYGFFISEGIEQRIRVGLKANVTKSKQENVTRAPFFWDISWAMLYYFKTSCQVRPYIGGGVGFGLMDLNILSTNLIIDVPVGILTKLSRNAALDFSIPIRVSSSIRAFFDTVETPITIGFRYFL